MLLLIYRHHKIGFDVSTETEEIAAGGASYGAGGNAPYGSGTQSGGGINL